MSSEFRVGTLWHKFEDKRAALIFQASKLDFIMACYVLELSPCFFFIWSALLSKVIVGTITESGVSATEGITEN